MKSEFEKLQEDDVAYLKSLPRAERERVAKQRARVAPSQRPFWWPDYGGDDSID